MQLTPEKRQEFLDYVHSGMTIGDAEAKAGITFDEGFGILDMNLKIHRYRTLNKETE